MTLHPIDHVAFVVLAVVFPIWGLVVVRKLAAGIRAGRTELRIRFFRRIIWEEWLTALVLLGVWFALGRGGGAIGLAPRGSPLAWIGYGLTALMCTLLLVQVGSIVKSPENLAAMREKFASVSFLMPQTRKELRTFDAVSVSAGICEEVIFRGYLMAYLMALLATPFWIAGVLSSVVFGLSHAYQGPPGILRTAALGGTFALLYGMTGSLWAPIVAHIAVDAASGRIAFAAISESSHGLSAPEQTG